MNTIGGLPALKRNRSANTSGISTDGMIKRIEGAVKYLAGQLELWDVGPADHGGFEIIIRSMLPLLEQDGISFTFPGRSQVLKLNQRKLSKIHESV